MKGDFSRGHAPDGAPYRRVLHQQGRVLLDSDVAALVAAQDHLHRLTVAGLGCPMGSPNLGGLVTAGRLLALFDALERPGARVRADGAAELLRDYTAQWLDRVPSLRITTAGAGDTVHVPLIAPLPGDVQRIVMWVQSAAAVVVTVTAGARSASPNVPATAGSFARVVLDFGGVAAAEAATLDVTVPAGTQLWVGLVETDEAGPFWGAAGWYAVDGLVAEFGAAGVYPTVSFPDGLGAPSPTAVAAGGPIVAYLEVHERLITAVEDPGLREAALGGLDTAVRTLPVGQLKVLALPVGVDAAMVLDAFADPTPSDATLEVATGSSTPDYDPCALPTIDGYAAADHRLYRFEVHAGGALGAAVLKWSRDNGSELFPILRIDGNLLVFAAGSPVRDGDLVELLGEPVDLGDEAEATIVAGRVVPARRRAGRLVVLQWADDDADGNPQFALVEPPGVAPLAIAVAWPFDPASLVRVRRWHGRVTTVGGTFDYPLESGLTLHLGGSDFRTGDWWQFQARVGPGNTTGDWRSAPHGPERLLAPMALLDWLPVDGRFEVRAWLDHRYPPICELDAHDVAFDGERVGSPSTTVQEALEELFERGPEIIEAGCGEIVIRPGVDLQAAFDAIPAGADARLCLHPGAWAVAQTVLVEDKGHLVIGGAGRATRITGDALDVVVRFVGCASVQLRDLDVSAGLATPDDGLNGAVTVEGTPGEVRIERVHLRCGGGAARRTAGLTVRSTPGQAVLPTVIVHQCDVEVGHLQTGILVVDAGVVRIEQNRVWCDAAPVAFADFATDAALWAQLGNVFVDRIVLDDDMAVTEPLRNRRRAYHSNQDGWGEAVLTFDTDPSLSSSFWDDMLRVNPCPGQSTATSDWLFNNLRKLGRRIARFLLGQPDPSYTIAFPAGGEALLRGVLTRLEQENGVAAGGQGIVVAGSRTGPLGPVGGGDSRWYRPPHQPEALVADNRIEGFVQGIHVGTSDNRTGNGTGRHFRTYRAQIRGNTVSLRIPSLARERHGIFVGNVQTVHVRDNVVDLTLPGLTVLPDGVVGWPSMKPVDGIRVFGMIGPTCIVSGNQLTGVYTGVRRVSLNPDLPEDGIVAWTVSDNAYFGPGQATVIA